MIGCSVVGFFQLDLRRNWSGHMSSEPDQRRQAANEGGRLTKVAFRFCSYKISSRPICSLALLNTRIAGWTVGERQKVGGRAIRADAWTLRGAHLLPQTRTRVLNEDLDDLLRRWYPNSGRNHKRRSES